MAKRTYEAPAVDIYRVEREIEDASGPTGKWKVTDTFGTYPEAAETVEWVRRHGGRARLVSLGRKTTAQLDAEIGLSTSTVSERGARSRTEQKARRYGRVRPGGRNDI